jgi:NAD-dependent dihydropyrimidine dehydrogenase PreA subunit
MTISKFDSVFDPAMSVTPAETVAREVVEKFNIANMTMYLQFFDIVSSAIVPPFDLSITGRKKAWKGALNFYYCVLLRSFELHEDSIYLDSKTKINLICQTHGIFSTTSNGFYGLGHGCAKCSDNCPEQAAENFIKKISDSEYTLSTGESYERNNKKVGLICSKHGVFFITPKSFNNSHGCAKCSDNCPEQAAENFIKKISDSEYTLSTGESYERNNKKVGLICSKHGVFFITPESFNNGHGCAKCSGKCPEQAAERFYKLINKLDYALKKGEFYTGAHNNVTLVCPNHGDFMVDPSNLRNGSRCKSCAVNSFENGEKRFYSIISKSVYKLAEGEYYRGANKNIVLVCSVHGNFLTTPSVVKRGSGCSKCSNTSIEQSKDRFNIILDELNYSLADGEVYEKDNVKIGLLCHTHGLFYISPGKLKSGTRCRDCSKNGFQTKKPATIYYLEFFPQPGRSVFKIGITNRTIKERYYGQSSTPYKTIWEYKFICGSECLKWEKRALTAMNKHRCVDKPVNGISNAELFDINVFPTIDHLWDLENVS